MHLLLLYVLLHLSHELELVIRDLVVLVYADRVEHALHLKEKETHFLEHRALELKRLGVNNHNLYVIIARYYMRQIFYPEVHIYVVLYLTQLIQVLSAYIG